MELKEGFAVRKRAKTEGMLTDKQVSSFGSAQVKPEARFVEEFLEEPTLFAPKPEFLVSTYIEDDTVLTHAVKTQNYLAVNALISAGVDPNISSRKGVTPISAASHKGNTKIMKALIDAGAAVNALNTSGSTALIQASHFGHVDAVQLLLQHNAQSDFANLKGTTALMRASQEGHVAISKLLLNSGADVNRKNYEGMNALMLASQRGHADMVMLLITSGASMDEQTAQGSTALMLACKRGHEKVVEVLVSMGAEIFMRDCRGRTARDTATRRQHITLLRYLDTQVQVRKVEERQRQLRTEVLLELRVAHQKGLLVLNATETMVETLIASVRADMSVIAQRGCLSTAVPAPGPAAQPSGSNYGRGQQLHVDRADPNTKTVIAAGNAATNPDHLLSVCPQNEAPPPIETTSTMLGDPESCVAVSVIADLVLDSLRNQQYLHHRAMARKVQQPSGVSLSTDHSQSNTDRRPISTPPLGGGISSGFPSNVPRSVIPWYIPGSDSYPFGGDGVEGDAVSRLFGVRNLRSHAGPPAPLRPRQPGFADWQWPLILRRCLDLPPGVFEMVLEMIPRPRVWQWSLARLRKRCKLAPQAAIVDICILVDEMIADMNIFSGPDQRILLQRLAHNPQIHPYLIVERGMPAKLLEALVLWSDVQSLASRSSDREVVFRGALARRMLDVATLLFRWLRHMSSSGKVLGIGASGFMSDRKHGGAGGGLGNDGGTDGDMLDGGEGGCGEDGGSEADGVMDQDQDTETEMPVEGDVDDAQEQDSDNEDGQIFGFNGGSVFGGGGGHGQI